MWCLSGSDPPPILSPLVFQLLSTLPPLLSSAPLRFHSVSVFPCRPSSLYPGRTVERRREERRRGEGDERRQNREGQRREAKSRADNRREESKEESMSAIHLRRSSSALLLNMVCGMYLWRPSSCAQSFWSAPLAPPPSPPPCPLLSTHSLAARSQLRFGVPVASTRCCLGEGFRSSRSVFAGVSAVFWWGIRGVPRGYLGVSAVILAFWLFTEQWFL